MNVLVAFLTSFIVANSDLPPPPIMPIVQQYSAETLWYMEYPGSEYRPDRMSVASVYKNDFIYLRNKWSPQSLDNVSTLVHELAHHLQHYVDKEYRCAGKKEEEAYEIQIEFVQRVGNMSRKEALKTIELTPVALEMQTRCPPKRSAP